MEISKLSCHDVSHDQDQAEVTEIAIFADSCDRVVRQTLNKVRFPTAAATIFTNDATQIRRRGFLRGERRKNHGRVLLPMMHATISNGDEQHRGRRAAFRVRPCIYLNCDRRTSSREEQYNRLTFMLLSDTNEHFPATLNNFILRRSGIGSCARSIRIAR